MTTTVQAGTRQKVFNYVSKHIMAKGFAPTIREIMDGCQISSTSVVLHHLRMLDKLGHLVRTDEVARGIALGAAAGMNSSLSLNCHAATRWAGTEVAQHLHDGCPGHVFQAWDQREFDCQCGCGHV